MAVSYNYPLDSQSILLSNSLMNKILILIISFYQQTEYTFLKLMKSTNQI